MRGVGGVTIRGRGFVGMKLNLKHAPLRGNGWWAGILSLVWDPGRANCTMERPKLKALKPKTPGPETWVLPPPSSSLY